MKNFIILVVTLAFAVSCKEKSSNWVQTIPIGEDVALIQELADMTNPCRKSENYIPDVENIESTIDQIVKINIHIIQNSEGKGNLAGNWGKAYVKQILSSANYNLGINYKMNLPIGNDTPVIPSRFGYQLWPTTYIPGDDGIYYHQDDEFYFNINRGEQKNIFDKEIFAKYGIQKDTVLNIFVQDVHLDSLNSPTYRSKSNGVAFSNWVKVANWYTAVRDTAYKDGKVYLKKKWSPPKLLNHEIGHVFNLRHAWGRDNCEDTPEHKNCWSSTGVPPCVKASNNIMDYNANQAALTPCQLGRVHMSMLTDEKKTKLLYKQWCDLDVMRNEVIDDDVTWNACKMVQGNIIIESGARLVIRCKTSMPNQSGILVKPGGELVLQGAHLYNDCGGEWMGIRSQKYGDKEGKVTYIGNLNKIEDSVHPITLQGASEVIP